uniref:(northern house mosquito) hypothetical protein n=1 Tax=Culex pipiens TaxID=7175 RepID=A0A8D8AYY2_CULPI
MVFLLLLPLSLQWWPQQPGRRLIHFQKQKTRRCKRSANLIRSARQHFSLLSPLLPPLQIFPRFYYDFPLFFLFRYFSRFSFPQQTLEVRSRANSFSFSFSLSLLASQHGVLSFAHSLAHQLTREQFFWFCDCVSSFTLGSRSKSRTENQ